MTIIFLFVKIILKMNIYMTSDLHADCWYKANKSEQGPAPFHHLYKYESLEDFINASLKPADILCVAGDTCDDPNLFVDFYRAVSLRYKKVFLVFGNHDLTVQNKTYFKNNPFTDTQAKLDFLKAELSKLGNVSLLDGSVEEYCGMKFGGTMGFNDFSWARKLEPEADEEKIIADWKKSFDARHWNYMGNIHTEIFSSQMKKLDYVVSQKPDVILTHYLPLFFGVEKQYEKDFRTTTFYFDGNKYLEELKDGTVWLGGHLHCVRTKDLVTGSGKTLHLKLNPLGFPDENCR